MRRKMAHIYAGGKKMGSFLILTEFFSMQMRMFEE
jgi:hypothetical protein